jgi:hypothetical protein
MIFLYKGLIYEISDTKCLLLRTLLFMNHEGCVNTLQEECKRFYAELGRDGRNQSFPSRFPCYYAARKLCTACDNIPMSVHKHST